MAQAADESFLSEGFTLGKRFRLERLLGRGASGSVWQATHLALSAPVAIKFLDQVAKHLHDQEEIDGYVDRFRFEAQVSARLSARTRHTVGVQDAGVFRGVPFLVMEYAPGRSLEQVIETDGTIPTAELLKIADHIGEALGAAHELGIIHRDVKTPNILRVEREGQESLYKLADFGVARMTGARALDLAAPKKTGEGMIVGTPAYMSPEQIGADTTCGPATDLWALGVVLYEAMTGRMPFGGVSLTELAMAISASPHDAPSKEKAFGPAVDAFFLRALAKRPVDRFDSAPDMARAFRAALEAPTETEKRLPSPTRRRRVTVVLAGVCVLAAAIGVGGWIMHTPSASSAEAPLAPHSEPQDGSARGSILSEPELSPAATSITALPSVAASPGPHDSKRRDSTSTHAQPTGTPTATAQVTVAPSAPPPVVETPTPNVVRHPLNKSEIQ